MTKLSAQIIAGIVLLFLITFFVQRIKINKLDNQRQLQNVELSTLKDSVETFVSKTGELVSKIQSVEIEKKNLKESLKIAGFDIKELKQENVKWRKINNALKIEMQSTGSVSTGVADTIRIETNAEGKTDTIYYSRVSNWSNDYMSLFNGKVEKGNLLFDYRYYNKFEILQTVTRKGTIVSVKFEDPKSKTISANSITVPKKKSKWWLWTAVGTIAGVLIAK
jgi:IS1 family transposase